MIAGDGLLPEVKSCSRSPVLQAFLQIIPAKGGGICMSAIPILLIVWAAVTACFLGLLAYKGQLTRYEEDQLFLNDNVSNEQRLQNEIVRKVNQIQPFVRVFGAAAAVATASIIGIFTYDAWLRLQ
jgi:hypothetical protein